MALNVRRLGTSPPVAYLANVKSCSVVSRLRMTARTASREIFSLRVLGCRAVHVTDAKSNTRLYTKSRTKHGAESFRLDPTLNATGTSAAQVGLEKLMGLGVVSHGMELPGDSAGLALGAIASSIVDRQFKQAGIYALTGVVLSFFGFIHGMHWGSVPRRS